MIELDYSLFIQIGLFLLLWVFLSRFVFRPFLRMLEQREQRTDGTLNDAQNLAEEAEQLKASYEQAIAKATEEGNAIKESIRHEAAQTREQLLAQARQETAHFLQTARTEIQVELEKGRATAVIEAEAIAQQMAEKILARKIS